MLISRMSLEHLDEVMAIERESFVTPWSESGFRQEILNRESSLPVVASLNGYVVGYGIAWCVADEIHIGNVAVKHDHRRKGIGTLLMSHLLERGRMRGCCLATLEVRRANVPAIELYTKLGFSSIAVRKGYYRDTGEDAIVMLKNFEPRTPPPARHDLIRQEG